MLKEQMTKSMFGLKFVNQLNFKVSQVLLLQNLVFRQNFMPKHTFEGNQT